MTARFLCGPVASSGMSSASGIRPSHDSSFLSDMEMTDQQLLPRAARTPECTSFMVNSIQMRSDDISLTHTWTSMSSVHMVGGAGIFLPKCHTTSPLTALVEPLTVLHTLISGLCPTLTAARIRSNAGRCGTLWRKTLPLQHTEILY